LAFGVALTIRLARDFAPRFLRCIRWSSGSSIGGCHELIACLTCNHVHLLVDVQNRAELSACMQGVAGEFARAYNRRKGRTNALWGDNFHATLVEGGSYLWRCLCYIELNMVRAGAVNHPREWEWVGYHEIMGE